MLAPSQGCFVCMCVFVFFLFFFFKSKDKRAPQRPGLSILAHTDVLCRGQGLIPGFPVTSDVTQE